MKDNFEKAVEMVKECGFQIIEIKTVTITRASIKMIRKMVSACIVGKMEPDMKDSS
jgi:hypothetical protein